MRCRAHQILSVLASFAWSTASESTFLGLLNRAFSFISSESSSYCIVINYVFTFRTINVFLAASAALWSSSNSISLSSRIRLLWMFICAAFKSHTEWSNAQRVSVPNATILLMTASTFHGLNYSDHMILAPPTITYYQNIVKLLTPPINCNISVTTFSRLRFSLTPLLWVRSDARQYDTEQDVTLGHFF